MAKFLMCNLESYNLSEKYGLSGMWQGLAYSRYPYFDAQYKARIRGDKLTRDYQGETVFATHPQRIALLSLTPRASGRNSGVKRICLLTL